MKKGFTLIELLVVVLIIGILSAIALPQYTKAVTKARFTEAMTNLKVLAEAVKLCELENGKIDMENGNEFCSDMSVLNVSVGTLLPPYVLETDFFDYVVDRGGVDYPWTVVRAQYKREDVCLCIHDDGSFAAGRESGCLGKYPAYDPAKLLNLTDSDCSCC